MLGQAFRLDSVRGSGERGWLRAFLLVAGETPIAFTLYYVGMDTMISGVLGYDRRYAKYSPGAILFRYMLGLIYERDTPRVLDFGEGDAEYKKHWANDEISVGSVVVVRNRPALRGQFALSRMSDATVRSLRGFLRLIGAERALVRRAKRSA